MQKINPKIIQLIGDVTIPLLGYFVWEWSLYFIVVFFIIDLAIKDVYAIKKSTLIIHSQHFNQQTPKIKNLKYIISSNLILSAIIVISHLFFYDFFEDFKLNEELYTFMMYKELGIPQIFFLIPLLYFGTNFQYKMEFIKPKLYLTINYQKFWKKHIINSSTILLATIILFIIEANTNVGESFYLLSLLVGMIIYRTIQLKFETKN